MENLQVTLGLLVLVGSIALLIAGATNKVVIYFDLKDFAVSFAPWGTLLITAILLNIYGKEGATEYTAIQYLILFAGSAISAGFFIWSIRLSIFYNRSTVLGIIIGLFKVFSALLGTFAIFSQFSRMTSDRVSARDVIKAAIWISILTWLGKKLINGEEVYIAKGWALQEPRKIVNT